MPSFESVDPRLGEKQFRRFEHLLAQGLRNFPVPTSFPTPSDMAFSTFLARFRDSIAGYRLNRWPSHHEGMEFFDTHDGKFVLRPDHSNRTVVFDTKQKQGRPPLDTSGSSLTPHQNAQLGPFELNDLEQHAFLLLLNRNKLLGFHVSLTHPLTVDVSSYPNVSVTPHANGITLIF